MFRNLNAQSILIHNMFAILLHYADLMATLAIHTISEYPFIGC